MTRILLILLTLSSCSVITFGQFPSLAKDAIFGVDYEITEEIFNSQPYSFAKVLIGKSIVAITVLSTVNNGVYTWVSADGEKIYTKDGKIIETFGLQNDMKIINSFNLQNIKFELIKSKEEAQERTFLIELDNPHALMSQETSFYNTGIDKNYFNSMLFEERFETSKLKWEGVNYYWVDPQGRVIKSVQNIHPRMPLVTIEFYYK
jgi:hypothetical protein